MSLCRRHLAIAAVCLTLAAGAAWRSLSENAKSGPSQAPQIGYTLLNGQQRHTRQLQGQVVLVNFWATSCGSCVAEMPALVATYQRFRAQGFQTLAVAMDYDPPAAVADFAESRQLPFPVVIDNTGAIARGFGPVSLTPTTFLINKRGQIVKRYLGPPDFVALQRLIEQLLAEA
jgi:peroxiredoxin